MSRDFYPPLPLPAAQIFLVCGPPGSGKSTYVAQNRADGDIVFDWDVIACAITGMPMYQRPEVALGFLMAMREGFMTAATQARGVKVWFITSSFSDFERSQFALRMNAEIVHLDVPEHICISRVAGRGEQHKQIVSQWFIRRRNSI